MDLSLSKFAKEPDSKIPTRTRIRYSSKFKVAWGEVGGDPQTAMELGEEQFKLCAELSFQPGLVAYVALHCVEAASLAVANRHEIQNETEEHRVAFQWKHILLEFWLEKRTEIPF